MASGRQRFNPKIDEGLEFISALGPIEIDNIEIRDLLYKLISKKNWDVVDEILKEAQKKNLLQKTDRVWIVTPEESNLVFEKPIIIKKEENTNCKLCGRKITTAFYVEFGSYTKGPFGSKCIHKMRLEYLLQ